MKLLDNIQLFEKIEHLASLFFSYDEIKLLLNKDDNFSFVISLKGTPENIAYTKGFLNAQIKIREEMVNSAIMGSPAAQKDILQIISETTTKNQLNG